MKNAIRKWIVLGSALTLWLGIWAPAWGQFSIVTKVTYVSQELTDRLDFRITAPVRVEKENLAKTHAVLIKIYGAVFNPEFSGDLIRTVKKCAFRPNVAQINDNSIFILFKGTSVSRLTITQKPHLLRIQIQKKSTQAAYRDNLHKGRILLEKKKFTASLTYFRRALRYRPNDPTAYFWAGKARFALGDWEAARYNLQQACRKPSLKSEAQQVLAFIQAKQNEKHVSPQSVFSSAKQDTLKNVPSAPEKAKMSVASLNPTPKMQSVEVARKKEKAKSAPKDVEAPAPSTASWFQLVLFLAILLTLAALPFVYVLSRQPKKRKKVPGVSFEKNLEAFQVQQERVMRQVHREQQATWPETERPFQARREKVEKRTAPDLGWREEPLLRNAYSHSELVKKVKKFASRGYTYDEIAQKLGMGKGELQLAMSLAGEKIEMAKEPGLRLTLDDGN